MNPKAHTEPPLSLAQLDALQLDNPFWQYSLTLWKNEALQRTLLDLQDKHEMRVNRLLFAMWLGKEKKAITPYLEAIEAATNAWYSQVVAPLRQIRKNLPKHSLRTNLQQSELQAEQIEQAILFDLSKHFANSTSDGEIEVLLANLIASGVPKTHLLLCIQACLPTFSDAEIHAHISQHAI